MERFSLTTPISSGSIISFDLDSKQILGLVLDIAKVTKYLVLDEHGFKHELSKNRIFVFEENQKLTQISHEKIKSELIKIRAEVNKITSSISIKDLWKKTSLENKEYSSSELTKIYFSELTLYKHIAIRDLICTERIHFQRGLLGFVPRADELINKMLIDAAEKNLYLDLITEFSKYSKTYLNNGSFVLEEKHSALIKSLENVAAHGEQAEASDLKDARLILTNFNDEISPNLPISKRSFDLLMKLGVFNQNTNLSIIRYRPKLEWNEGIFEEVKLLQDSYDPNKFELEDLTSLKSITIDDPQTSDIDDALSLEELSNNEFRLFIHISNVADFIKQGSKLDIEAKERATSIYCPDINIPMLPLEISEDILSLKKDAIRSSVTAIFKVTSDFKIEFERFCRSKIKVSSRLNYEEVDQILEENSDPFILNLYNISCAFEEARIESGAVRVEKRDAIVSPLGVPLINGLKIVEVEETSPARILVSEMMIIYNKALAEFLFENKIAAPFRNQDYPDPFTDKNIPQGPAYEYAIKSRLKRSEVSTFAKWHYTLGLKFYTQCTSPIRRYLDLVVQRQLIAFLEKQLIPYSKTSLSKVIEETGKPIAMANIVMRESKRFWLLKYLNEKAKFKSQIKGTIIKLDFRLAFVELEEVYISTGVKLQFFKKKPLLGDIVTFNITKVDAHQNYVRLEPV